MDGWMNLGGGYWIFAGYSFCQDTCDNDKLGCVCLKIFWNFIIINIIIIVSVLNWIEVFGKSNLPHWKTWIQSLCPQYNKW